MPMFSTVSTGEARAGHVLSRVSMVSENVHLRRLEPVDECIQG